MSWRYGAALTLVAVLAFVFALWGARGVGTIVVITIPVTIAALATGLTRQRFPATILMGACVGLLPALVLVIVNELGILGFPPPESIVSSTEAGSLLILIFLGIPCAVAGVIGGSIGALVGHGQQASR